MSQVVKYLLFVESMFGYHKGRGKVDLYGA